MLGTLRERISSKPIHPLCRHLILIFYMVSSYNISALLNYVFLERNFFMKRKLIPFSAYNIRQLCTPYITPSLIVQEINCTSIQLGGIEVFRVCAVFLRLHKGLTAEYRSPPNSSIYIVHTRKSRDSEKELIEWLPQSNHDRNRNFPLRSGGY